MMLMTLMMTIDVCTFIFIFVWSPVIAFVASAYCIIVSGNMCFYFAKNRPIQPHKYQPPIHVAVYRVLGVVFGFVLFFFVQFYFD